MASVHRFRDKVAIHVGNGQTVYLSPAKAAQLGLALIDCAEDVVKYPKFSESPFNTVEVEEK